jgi:integrase
MKPRTGSVFYSKADKRYIAKISATHPITKKIKEWKRHAQTSVEAHKKIKELQDLADRWVADEGSENTERVETFADLAKIFEAKRLTEPKYIDGYKVSGVRSLATPKSYLANLVKHLGAKRLKSIKFSDLEDFKATLIEAPTRNGQRTISGINRQLEFLNSVLNYAVTCGYIDRNPFQTSKIKLIDRPRETRRERMPGFGEDLAIRAQCETDSELAALYPPFVIAVDTGLRRNEMLTLAISDIDFAENVIHLRRENAKANKARDIPMTTRVRSLMGDLCRGGEGLVFRELLKAKPRGRKAKPRGNHERLPCVGLFRLWKEARRRAQITNLTWHDLRHAFVSRSILAGIPPAAVLKASGHSSDEWKRYLNMTPDQLRGLLRPMERQTLDEVRLYAARVMKGLRDALGYEEIERLFNLLKD